MHLWQLSSKGHHYFLARSPMNLHSLVCDLVLRLAFSIGEGGKGWVLVRWNKIERLRRYSRSRDLDCRWGDRPVDVSRVARPTPRFASFFSSSKEQATPPADSPSRRGHSWELDWCRRRHRRRTHDAWKRCTGHRLGYLMGLCTKRADRAAL